jgi:hypothetical protein
MAFIYCLYSNEDGGKAEADNRVERSLYERANGYSYDAFKIFRTKDGDIIRAPYREHVPPDITACIFWLKNRDHFLSPHFAAAFEALFGRI